jgi:hypothetical protein
MRAASWLVTRTPGLWTTFYKSLFPTSKPADFPDAVASLKSNLAEPGRMSAPRGQLAEILAGLDLRYSEVRCPTLIITGTKDPDMAVEATPSRRTTLGRSPHRRDDRRVRPLPPPGPAPANPSGDPERPARRTLATCGDINVDRG